MTLRAQQVQDKWVSSRNLSTCGGGWTLVFFFSSFVTPSSLSIYLDHFYSSVLSYVSFMIISIVVLFIFEMQGLPPRLEWFIPRWILLLTKGVFVWGRRCELPIVCLMTVSQKQAWLNSAEVSFRNVPYKKKKIPKLYLIIYHYFKS